jgi:hypothetical protein
MIKMNKANHKGKFVFKMAKITVPVLWNIDSFLNGALMSIDVRSRYVTTVPKLIKPIPPFQIVPPGSFTPCLQVEDPDFGVFYLNMPLTAYQALIRLASGSSAPLVATKIYSIGSPSTTIIDVALNNVTIVAIWKNGIELNINNPAIVSYSGDTLTFGSSLAPGDTVGVIYHSN